MAIIVNAILFLLSAYWFQQGIVVYKFWTRNLPGNGFIPVIFSVVLMILSASLVVIEVRKTVKARKNASAEEVAPEEGPDRSWLRALVPIVYSILAIVAFRWLGVVISMFLTAFVWLFWISKIELKKSLSISLILTLIVYGIFVMWLRIPFPRGIFGF